MDIKRSEILLFLGLICYWPLSAKSWNDQLWIESASEAIYVWGVFSLFIGSAIVTSAIAFILRTTIEQHSDFYRQACLTASVLLCVLNCVVAFADLEGDVAFAVLMLDAVVLGFTFVLLTFLWAQVAMTLKPNRVLFLTFTSAATSTALTLATSVFEPIGILMAATLPLLCSILLSSCAPLEHNATAEVAPTTPLPWGFIGLVVLSSYIFALLYGLMPVEYVFSVNYTWLASGICSIALSLLVSTILWRRKSSRGALLRTWIVLSLAVILVMFITVIMPAQFIDLSKSLVLASQDCISVFLWGMLVITCRQHGASPVAVIPSIYAVLLGLSGCIANYLGPLLVSMFPALGGPYFTPIAALFTLLAVLASLVPLAHIALRSSDPMALEDRSEPLDAAAWICEEYNLSSREADVAIALAKGYSVQKTSDKLHLSPHTVKSHAKSIYRKMDIHKRQELIDIVERHICS